MENQLDHVQYLVFRHTDMLNQQEHNTDEFGNITYELINTWKMEQDDFGFFVFENLPTDYTVYPVLHADNSTARLAEYTPTNYTFGSYKTYKEAVSAVKEHRREKDEMYARVEEQKAKMDELMKKNSLNERYKDFQPKPKAKKQIKTLGYLENLMKKARERTEEMHARVEENRISRNRQLQLDSYVEALINH